MGELFNPEYLIGFGLFCLVVGLLLMVLFGDW